MEFLHNDKETFSQAINLVTNKNGIRPEIVEKDYYVTLILKEIATSSDKAVFKGGTSLSKALKAGTLFVTPGVRPAGSAVGDQKRVATPADAVRDGATHLVVGRPILAADDPVAAAAAILAEMAS